MRNNRLLIITLTALPLMVACSTDRVGAMGYGAIQSANRTNCTKAADATSINECLRQNDMSYEEYQKQRRREQEKATQSH